MRELFFPAHIQLLWLVDAKYEAAIVSTSKRIGEKFLSGSLSTGNSTAPIPGIVGQRVPKLFTRDL
jgi:hypothetical protein